MDKERFRTYRVWLLAAALIMLWLLFALLSRCGRADAVSDGRDGVVVCDTMPLMPTDTAKWKNVPVLQPVKPVSPNKPPNVE